MLDTCERDDYLMLTWHVSHKCMKAGSSARGRYLANATMCCKYHDFDLLLILIKSHHLELIVCQNKPLQSNFASPDYSCIASPKAYS